MNALTAISPGSIPQPPMRGPLQQRCGLGTPTGSQQVAPRGPNSSLPKHSGTPSHSLNTISTVSSVRICPAELGRRKVSHSRLEFFLSSPSQMCYILPFELQTNVVLCPSSPCLSAHSCPGQASILPCWASQGWSVSLLPLT